MRKSAEFAVFAVIGFAGVALNELLMVFLVGSLHGQEMISKMISATVVLMWNFGARKLTLFRERKD